MTRELRKGFPCQDAFTWHKNSRLASTACSTQEHNERARGAQLHNFLGTESLQGAQKSLKNIARTFFLMYICFQKTSGSNTGAPNLLLAPGTICPRYSPGNTAVNIHQTSEPRVRPQLLLPIASVTPLISKMSHSKVMILWRKPFSKQQIPFLKTLTIKHRSWRP